MKAKIVDHARDNAIGWAETIAELVAALECDFDELDALTDEGTDCHDKERHTELVAQATIDGYIMKDADEVRERIQEGPLSVEVRSPWYSPGADEEDRKPSEFRILLSTGGPALQIRGELDEYKQPYRAWLEYRDWGTPWTQLIDGPIENDTLLTYCQQFYFGE